MKNKTLVVILIITFLVPGVVLVAMAEGKKTTIKTGPEKEVVLNEKKTFEDCGWVVSLDSIWKDDQGKLRADLVTFRANTVSKPISGGYAEGMIIEIGEAHCKFLVKKIDEISRHLTFI